jgi:F-type H+-transporting ATPase subunit g
VSRFLISSLAAYRKPLMYNLSVTRALLKQVYIAERLQPPTSLSTIQSAYSTIWARASNPEYWRQAAKNGELARVGVYAIEAYGIFKVCPWAHSLKFGEANLFRSTSL